MIIKIEGKCQYEDCNEPATCIACGGKHWREEMDSHPQPGLYCEAHADMVSEEVPHEYIEACPNCGCLFGMG